MHSRPIGIPWTSATSLDSHLRLPQQSAAGLKKTRQALRDRLAAAQTISLGRRGTLSLDNAALVPCLQTASRWGTEAAFQLSETYQSVGMARLVGSALYRKALEIAREAIRRTAVEVGRAETAQPYFLPDLLVDLVESNELVRKVAEAMDEIHAEVASLRPEVKSYGGHLVRVEGREAIVVVDLGEREVLRAYDAGFLLSQGIEQEEDAFVLQEIRWSPETVVSAFLPAYRPGVAALIDLRRDLIEGAVPLGELPEHLRVGGPAPAGERGGAAEGAAASAAAAEEEVEPAAAAARPAASVGADS